MKTKQWGFTLLELMIVVAITDILAILAIPAYSDYSKRANAIEAIELMAGSKAAVAEFYATNGTWPENNNAAGIASAGSIKGNSVTSITVNGSYIAAVVNQRIEPGKKIVLKASDISGSISWSCNPAISGTDVNTKYLPTTCR